MHGCGGWLGLVLYIGPKWGYGGGPRRGVGRCGLPLLKKGGGRRARGLAPISPYPQGSWSRFRDPFGVSLADAFVYWRRGVVQLLRLVWQGRIALFGMC
eukprot:scaffold1302_cov114-Isochrysis_galbana.AAC.14